jgi:hypothetical protein
MYADRANVLERKANSGALRQTPAVHVVAQVMLMN